MHETDVATEITHVAVYEGEAKVVRVGEAVLEAGEHILVVRDLPERIRPDSVRARAWGDGARLYGVDVSTTHESTTNYEEVAALEAECEGLRDARAALEDRWSSADTRRSLLESFGAASGARLARAVAGGAATFDDVRHLEASLGAELDDVMAGMRELGIAIRTVARDLTVAEDRLGHFAHPGTTVRRAVGVRLDAGAGGRVGIEVSYLVGGADWNPSYDVRVEGETLHVTMRAHVTQTTGEEWPPVPLDLSTARPAALVSVPELEPWYVTTQAPTVLRDGLPGAAAQPMAPAAAPPPAVAESRQMETTALAEVLEATVATSGATARYEVAGSAGVPGDGQPHETTIASFEPECEFDYVTAPKLAAEAYLRGRCRAPADLFLLPGKVSVHQGDAYVGSTWIDTTVPPGDELELQLGVDPRVKVEWELTRSGADKKILGNTTRVERRHEIEVRSTLDFDTSVTVLDVIPTTDDPKVKVSRGDLRPEPHELDERGRIEWRVDLPAGATATLSAEFTVEHPAGSRVLGL
ncbi:MAG: mucoidy inhibitor MuiA family protein [Acidimicrobiia bacterium]|nr:mucoidy inhibitor MuiA family protein [Acidimicrobiia bacterium]